MIPLADKSNKERKQGAQTGTKDQHVDLIDRHEHHLPFFRPAGEKTPRILPVLPSLADGIFLMQTELMFLFRDE